MADDLKLGLGPNAGKTNRDDAQYQVEKAYEEFRGTGDAYDMFNVDSFDMGAEDTGWF